ncbi:hypothetical protein D3C86_1789050 [compost metagenome]
MVRLPDPVPNSMVVSGSISGWFGTGGGGTTTGVSGSLGMSANKVGFFLHDSKV